MKYMGSKRRIAKYILPIILENRYVNQWYVEPFCGGCNLIDKVTGNRIANDLNKYVIALFKEIQQDEYFIDKLPHISEDDYKKIQHNKEDYPDWLVGYAGFNLSFGAKFFGGYRRDKAGVRNYENEAQQNLKIQQNLIKDIIFYNLDYKDITIPEKSIIYCDPPYQNTTKYKNKELNYGLFWEWCRIKTMEGHKVFISEYNAPDDFKCIWSKELVSSLTQDTGSKKGIERLFIYDKQSV